MERAGNGSVKMNWREIANDNQPLSITASVVKDYLLRCGQQRMANWLDSQMEMPRNLSQALKRLEAANAELRERLYQYEPPAKQSEGRSYRSGPMSDG